MNKNEVFLMNSEIEIRRQAAKIRAIYLREMFGRLGQRIRATAGRRNSRKNGQKIANHVGGATA